jgi:hypothetical protein
VAKMHNKTSIPIVTEVEKEERKTYEFVMNY